MTHERELTRQVGVPAPPKLPGASEDLDPNSVGSISTTRPCKLNELVGRGARRLLLPLQTPQVDCD